MNNNNSQNGNNKNKIIGIIVGTGAFLTLLKNILNIFNKDLSIISEIFNFFYSVINLVFNDNKFFSKLFILQIIIIITSIIKVIYDVLVKEDEIEKLFPIMYFIVFIGYTLFQVYINETNIVYNSLLIISIVFMHIFEFEYISLFACAPIILFVMYNSIASHFLKLKFSYNLQLLIILIILTWNIIYPFSYWDYKSEKKSYFIILCILLCIICFNIISFVNYYSNTFFIYR